MYNDNGGIDEDQNATDPQGSMLGNSLQQKINAALGVIDDTLAYGYRKYGLTSGTDPIKEASAMPSIPGTQSESGIPPRRPQPPMGKQAARMPMQPASQSESGIAPQQPMPGPLPPTSNPFGKRADASEGENNEPEQAPEGGIDTEEELA